MDIMRLVMVIIAFIAVFGIVMMFFTALLSAGSNRSRRLQELKEGRSTATVTTTRKRKKSPDRDPAPLLSGFLQHTDLGRRIQLSLLRSGMLLRPSELLLITAIAGVTGFVAGYQLGHGFFFGVLVGVVGLAAPFITISSKRTKRQARISAQLPDALDLLASSLRSGHSLLRGLQVVVTQMQPPITEEFERVIDEVRLGQSLELALDHVLDRTGNYDLELIISAIQTQLSIGGNLAEIMDNISGMIRERVRLSSEIAAATAEGRMSAVILGGMPFALALLINVVSPGYLAPLLEDPFGLVLLGVAGGMMLLGILIIRGMLNIDL